MSSSFLIPAKVRVQAAFEHFAYRDDGRVMARTYHRKRVNGVEVPQGVEHAGRVPPLVQLAGNLWALDEDGRCWRFMHDEGRWLRHPLKGVDDAGRAVELPRFRKLHCVDDAVLALGADGAVWKLDGKRWTMMPRLASIVSQGTA